MRWEEGVVLTGRIGAGKSTALRILVETALGRKRVKETVKRQFRNVLENDIGLLWFTVKPDEADIAETILDPGITLRFSPGNGVRFNPLTYEMSRKGGSALSLATLLTDINEVVSETDKKGEGFWETNFTVATMHALNLTWLTLREEASLAAVYRVLMTSPATIAETQTKEWNDTPCGKAIGNALAKFPNDARVGTAANYLKNLLPSAGEKVRGAVLSQATNTLLPFTLPPLSETTSGVSNITPELLDGVHTILDYDILTHGKHGQMFQLMMSFFMQEYLLRRSNPRPYIFVRDEYQYFAHPKRDIKAQSVARSQGFISMAAFQTIPVLVDGLGGGIEAKVKAEALYALHVNKYMLNNNCVETNETNAKILGMDRQMFFSTSQQSNQKPEWWDCLGVGQQSVSMSQQYHYRVPPVTFTRLKTGGEENGGIVEAIYHNGSTYQKVEFDQCLSRRTTRNK